MNRIWADAFWQDLRYASRSLRKSRGYTAAAVLLVTLGIAATTTIFSVVYALLLRPLPYPQPGRIVRLVRADRIDVTTSEFEFWKDHAAAYSSVASHRYPTPQSLDTGTDSQWIQTIAISPAFFQTLGVQPGLGREFLPQDVAPNAPRSIVLTDALWRQAFGRRADVLNQTVKLDGASYTVAGVLPPGFWFPSPADAFVPLLGRDMGTNTAVIGRLKPGIGLREAGAEAGPLARSYTESGAPNLPRDYRGLTPQSLQTVIAGDTRTNLMLLFGAVLLLLLIVCSNLVGLLMARLAARRKEIAVRLALGSGAARLVRQYLLENAIVSLAGGCAGVLAAAWLLDALLALIPFPVIASSPVGVNTAVLLFALIATLGTNLLCGVAPLFTSARVDVSSGLKSGGPAASPRQPARAFLVACEVALSSALLIPAALLIQSLYHLHREKLGFAPQGVMTFSTPLSLERRGKPEELRRFEAAVLDRSRTMPGYRAAGGINYLPLVGRNNFPAQPLGHPEQRIGGTEVRAVTPGYFEAMAIPVLRGRTLTDRDTANAPLVSLISESLAALWWPGRDPVGEHVVIGEGSFQVAGVVGDTKRLNLKEAFRPTVYLSPSQMDWPGGMTWVLRGTFSDSFAQQLRQAIQEIDPRQRIAAIRPMEEIVTSSTSDSRFDAWIFGTFAGLALLLAAVGIYGLLSFSVAGRTKEIGTRMALGASAAQVLRLVLRQGMATVAIGLAAGLAGGLLLSRALATLLFGVKGTDVFSYAAVAAVLATVGLLASYLPARRASKVDPIAALRAE